MPNYPKPLVSQILNASADARSLLFSANFSAMRTLLGLGSAALLATADVLQSANNLSDLKNVATARTNLGLGSAALLSSNVVLQSANNLADVTSVSSARTNLGLGTLATLNAAPAGTLTGATLASGVLVSSLTSVGTLNGGSTGVGFTVALSVATVTGTLADARLSSNVPLLNVANTFSVGGQVISSAAVGSVPLTIKGFASQTANLFNVTDSANNIYFELGPKFTFTANGDFNARSTIWAPGGTGTTYGHRVLTTATQGTAGGNHINFDSAISTSSTTGIHTGLFGFQGNINVASAASLTQAIGYSSQIQVTAAGNISDAYNFRAKSLILSNGGATTRQYGFYCEAMTGAGTNYAWYSNAGLNRFGDSITLVHPGTGTNDMASLDAGSASVGFNGLYVNASSSTGFATLKLKTNWSTGSGLAGDLINVQNSTTTLLQLDKSGVLNVALGSVIGGVTIGANSSGVLPVKIQQNATQNARTLEFWGVDSLPSNNPQAYFTSDWTTPTSATRKGRLAIGYYNIGTPVDLMTFDTTYGVRSLTHIFSAGAQGFGFVRPSDSATIPSFFSVDGSNNVLIGNTGNFSSTRLYCPGPTIAATFASGSVTFNISPVYLAFNNSANKISTTFSSVGYANYIDISCTTIPVISFRCGNSDSTANIGMQGVDSMLMQLQNKNTVSNSGFRFAVNNSTVALDILTDGSGNTKIGMFGVSAVARQTVNAACTDLATAITLVNQIRSALIALGPCQ